MNVPTIAWISESETKVLMWSIVMNFVATATTTTLITVVIRCFLHIIRTSMIRNPQHTFFGHSNIKSIYMPSTLEVCAVSWGSLHEAPCSQRCWYSQNHGARRSTWSTTFCRRRRTTSRKHLLKNQFDNHHALNSWQKRRSSPGHKYNITDQNYSPVHRIYVQSSMIRHALWKHLKSECRPLLNKRPCTAPKLYPLTNQEAVRLIIVWDVYIDVSCHTNGTKKK